MARTASAPTPQCKNCASETVYFLRSNIKRMKLLPKTCHNHLIKIYMYLCIGKFGRDSKQNDTRPKEKRGEEMGTKKCLSYFYPVQNSARKKRKN